MAAPGYWVLIAAATSSQGPGLRDEIATLAPCSAIRSAIALPIPLVEPVMMATLPVRSNRFMATFPKRLFDFRRAPCRGEPERSSGRGLDPTFVSRPNEAREGNAQHGPSYRGCGRGGALLSGPRG